MPVYFPENQFEENGLADLHRIPQDRNKSGAFDTNLFRTHIENYARNVGNIMYLEICPQKLCRTAWDPKEINGWLQNLKFQSMDSNGGAPYSHSIDPESGWNPNSNRYNSPEKILAGFRQHEISVITVEGCYEKNWYYEIWGGRNKMYQHRIC